MGSSAQKSSGVHWCRRQVRFNEVPEKVPEKVWQALVQSQVTSNRFSRFRRRFRRSSGRLGAEPGQIQQGSGEGSGEGSVESSVEGLGGVGAEPGQVQQVSGEGSGEGLGSFVKFNRGPEKVWEALVQSQVRFNRVPQVRFNRAPEKFRRRFRKRFRESLVQRQVRFNRVPEKVPEKVWEALVQSQVRFSRIRGHLVEGNRLRLQHASEKTCKKKSCGCWGNHRSLSYFCLTIFTILTPKIWAARPEEPSASADLFAGDLPKTRKHLLPKSSQTLLGKCGVKQQWDINEI